jgi:hypothetical protein
MKTKKTSAVENLTIAKQRHALKQIREKWSEHSRFYPFFTTDRLVIDQNTPPTTIERFCYQYVIGLIRKRKKDDDDT